ncbi:tyrosine-protein phosphatase [Rhodococcus sp. 114MFTsu3.1]|uniref:tyrosine-protein phosphatase n=1 Tax=Rhodococcus sp. 114MFTsu3.1 TaxID=1172184 RepID=UPI00037912DE|nr:tyrosine-protein phosphatase [Rhodococcus sp. 114MFTsu3.1]
MTQQSLARNDNVAGITVPGLYNLRSTGEWTATNGVVKPWSLFRSDSPARLDNAGAAALTALGIDHIIDLRSADETASSAYAFDGIERTAVRLELIDPTDALTTDKTLADLYCHLVDHNGPMIARALRAIAAPTAGAALVHCAAGKDRTGIVVAFALLAVGVPRENVVLDYAASHNNLQGSWTESALETFAVDVTSLEANVLEIINGSPAPVIEILLDRLDEQYGGAQGYLQRHGFDADDFAALHARLVTPEAPTRTGEK